MAGKHNNHGLQDKNANNARIDQPDNPEMCREKARLRAGTDADATVLWRAGHGSDWPAILNLLKRAFAGMEGRIDPPSSLVRVTPETLAQTADTAEIWLAGRPGVATVTLTPKAGGLYIGKLAVDPDWQGRGVGRRLLALAEDRARSLNLPFLWLETRVELVENHAFFVQNGFVETGRTAHPGFDRPTTVVFRRNLG